MDLPQPTQPDRSNADRSSADRSDSDRSDPDRSEAMSDTRYPALDPVGRRAIEAIRARLMIDPEWSETHDDGFSWWSHRLRQRFRVEGPVDLEGLPTWWASFETDVAAGIEGSDAAKGFVAYAANRVSNLYATVVDGDRLRHRARVYFLPETLEHRVALLSDRALLSNIDAHRIADTFIGRAPSLGLGGSALRVDASRHPVSGSRPEPDEMLTVRDTIFAPLGETEAPGERRPDLAAAGRLLSSVTRPDVEVRVGRSDVEGLAGTFLSEAGIGAYNVHIGVRHPILGLGALSLLRVLPRGDGTSDAGSGAVRGSTEATDQEAFEAARRRCERLDAAEWRVWEPLLSLGAWVPDRIGATDTLALTHATFHPNATLVPGLGTELAADALMRFSWAVRFFGGGRGN